MGIFIVNAVALTLIIFVIWWFFGSRPKAFMAGSHPIKILVENGVYEPSHIKIPAEKTVKLLFIRHDPTPCAETVSFPQLNMSYALPINQTVEVIIPPQKSGEIDFTCQMGMYRGKIIVE